MRVTSMGVIARQGIAGAAERGVSPDAGQALYKETRCRTLLIDLVVRPTLLN